VLREPDGSSIQLLNGVPDVRLPIITSAKEVMFLPEFVCLSVC